MKKGIELRVAGVFARDGKVLLVRHEKEGRAYWVLPGGHVEPGETLADALKREMREELGLDIVVGPLVIVHDFIDRDKRHVVNHDFLVDATSVDLTVKPQGSMREARFFRPQEMHDIGLRPDFADILALLIAHPPEATVYLGKL